MQKTFLFAGASSAIALATALQLKQQGHKIIGISTKQTIDVYDEFITIEKYESPYFPLLNEKIDGLVYFPGTINLKPFHRLTSQEFITDYEINALGAVKVTQHYLSLLKKSEQASIVYFSSIAAQQGMPFHTSIAMAKSAIEGLTKSLAAELAPNIRVNCIAPSLTKTPLADKFTNTLEKIEASEKRHPLKKIGTPNGIANALIFLLSEQSSWITGQVLAIDGGMSTLKL